MAAVLLGEAEVDGETAVRDEDGNLKSKKTQKS